MLAVNCEWQLLQVDSLPVCVIGLPFPFCQRSCAARSDDHWTLLPDRDVGCQSGPFSLCSAAWCCEAECSWLRDSLGWTVADMLSRSCLNETTLFTAQYYKQEDDRKTEGGQKVWHIPPHAPVLPFTLSPAHTLPAYHLYAHKRLTYCKRDAAPTLQVVSREVRAQLTSSLLTLWPPALQAGLPLCVLAPLFSPQIFTLVI